MACSFAIPLSCIFSKTGELLVEYKTTQVFSPVIQSDFAGNQYIARMETHTIHEIGLDCGWFQVHPSFADMPNGTTMLTGFTFTGFKETCELLLKIFKLSLPYSLA